MTNDPSKTAQYYPREKLQLQPDVEGAKMWAVTLEKTMFTYFEIEPQSRFERHNHESEQITMVLEGALFFEIDSGVIRVGEGEVIALPSWVPHAVFTTDEPAKAVDAWSPVREAYKK